jgi:hypothetical protein
LSRPAELPGPIGHRRGNSGDNYYEDVDPQFAEPRVTAHLLFQLLWQQDIAQTTVLLLTYGLYNQSAGLMAITPTKICNLELEAQVNLIDQILPLYLSVESIPDGTVDPGTLQCHNDVQCRNNRTSFSIRIRTFKYPGEVGEGMDEAAEVQVRQQ